jgi:hypothetical protein
MGVAGRTDRGRTVLTTPIPVQVRIRIRIPTRLRHWIAIDDSDPPNSNAISDRFVGETERNEDDDPDRFDLEFDIAHRPSGGQGRPIEWPSH